MLMKDKYKLGSSLVIAFHLCICCSYCSGATDSTQSISGDRSRMVLLEGFFGIKSPRELSLVGFNGGGLSADFEMDGRWSAGVTISWYGMSDFALDPSKMRVFGTEFESAVSGRLNLYSSLYFKSSVGTTHLYVDSIWVMRDPNTKDPSTIDKQYNHFERVVPQIKVGAGFLWGIVFGEMYLCWTLKSIQEGETVNFTYRTLEMRVGLRVPAVDL